MNIMLPILAEIRKAEACGRLVLAAFAHTCDDKHEYRYRIRGHFDELLSVYAHTGDIVVYYEQSAEQNRAENTYIRLPDCKNYKRDCKPASVTETVVRPNTVGIIHNIVQSAESRYNTADAG